MRLIALLLLLLCSYPAYAAAPLITLIPEKSEIRFIATQNHVPVEGKFSRFTATIHFAADQLASSSVKAEIDLGSVQTDYDEIADNLKGEAWFDSTHFPSATFESQQFTLKAGNHYEAVGTLALHGHTAPVTLSFTVIHEAGGMLKIEGETTLKRSDFAIGTGEWAATSVVADEVKIKIVAVGKP